MKDLLGNEITVEEARAKVKRRDPEPNGYAAPPGTGPSDQTCRTCCHLFRNEMRSGKAFLKCSLRRADWTGGRKSDILAKAPACRMWEATW